MEINNEATVQITEHSAVQTANDGDKKKKSSPKKALIILGVIVVVLVIIGIVGNSGPDKKAEKSIEKIGEVSVDSLSAIEEAESLFNELSDADKEKVENQDVLVSAREQYEKIKALYDAIEIIGEVTLEKSEDIENARKLFDACDESMQTKITNADKLIAAESALALLNAKEAEKLIADIGEVTFESKSKIEAAEKIYNGLSEEAKNAVSNYAVLTAAREKFNEVEKAEGSKRAAEAFALLDKSYDKVQGITWYEPTERPYYADTRSYVLPYIGIQNGNAWLRLAYWYTADDWIFWENLTIMVDGKKYYEYVGAFGTERDNDTEVWEYYDKAATDDDIEMLWAIANSVETIVRFQGDNYHYDLTISSSDKNAIKKVLTAYEYADYLE